VIHLEALGDFLLVFTSDGIVREYRVDVIMNGIDAISSAGKQFPRRDFSLSSVF